MIKNLCSKISCVLKSVIGDIRIEKKVTEAALSDADLFDKTQSESHISETKPIQSKKEPVEINIHNPICEYVHGKQFTSPPTWIVVHYTACVNVGAKSMCKAMKSNTGASSHFYIDEKDIYSAVPLKYIAWHVGNGKCKQPNASKELPLEDLANYKCKDWRYDLAAKNHLKWIEEGDDFKGNSCSLGVDFCVKKKSSISKKATDSDWYFEDETVENVAKTVAYLANVYKIDDSHIIRHCDCVGKLCPQPFTYPFEKGDAEWEKFKEKVGDYRERGVIARWL
jgi:hypothetical protein